MKPLQPLKPMAPMTRPEKWWSSDFGEASSSGAQHGTRYAYFTEKRLLIIERGGELSRFDTGPHIIGGVSQTRGGDESLTFTSQHGPVRLKDLEELT